MKLPGFELSVKDFEREKKFYENVLNASLTEMETDGFKSLTFPFDGQNVSGSLVQRENISANPSTVIYFNAGTNLSPSKG